MIINNIDDKALTNIIAKLEIGETIGFHGFKDGKKYGWSMDKLDAPMDRQLKAFKTTIDSFRDMGIKEIVSEQLKGTKKK